MIIIKFWISGLIAHCVLSSLTFQKFTYEFAENLVVVKMAYKVDEKLQDTVVNGTFYVKTNIYDILIGITFSVPSIQGQENSTTIFDRKIAHVSVTATKLLGGLKGNALISSLTKHLFTAVDFELAFPILKQKVLNVINFRPPMPSTPLKLKTKFACKVILKLKVSPRGKFLWGVSYDTEGTFTF